MHAELELRELSVADIDWLVELDATLFAVETPWSAAIFREELSGPGRFYFGAQLLSATAPPQLVGYAGIALLGDGLELMTIGTDPKFQGQGVARALMDNICHIADTMGKPINLEVRVGNTAAVSLYEKYGFSHSGVRPRYYPGGIDAHVMVRPPQAQGEKS